MEAALGKPLCTRIVSAPLLHHGLSVEIAIYAPYHDPKHDNWWCVIRLNGIGQHLNPAREEWRLGGVDGFGALANALEHIPRVLESTGLDWAWGEDTAPVLNSSFIPWHGFSRAIAPGMPVTFKHRMKALIDSETEAAIRSGEMRQIAQSDLGKPPI